MYCNVKFVYTHDNAFDYDAFKAENQNVHG